MTGNLSLRQIKRPYEIKLIETVFEKIMIKNQRHSIKPNI